MKLCHPRMLLADFTVAGHLLKHGLKRLRETRFFRSSPQMLIQPMDKLDGGLSGIEKRAWYELCLAAGARKAWVWTGDVLDAEGLRRVLAEASKNSGR